MYRSSAFRLTGVRRLAALLMLATAAACGDDPTGSRPPVQPGPEVPAAVASVEIDPGSLQLPVDGTRGLSAKLRAHSGAELTGRAVSWSSSDETVVRVDINGNVTALKVGTAVITATSGSVQGQSTITVVPPASAGPVAQVVVLSEGADLEPGESWQLGVQLRAVDGTVLQGRTVTWSSSDSTVIRAFAGGQVLGLRGGTATIRATSEGKSGSVTLVIPAWLQFQLRSLAGQALPAVTEVSADTTSRTEHGMLVTEYRQRVSGGQVWLSTLDSRYRQRYLVQTWKRTVSYFQGNTITGAEELIDSRYVNDEGRAEQYDMWTGEPIYESTVIEGHSFRTYRTASRGRLIHQRLPGTTDQSFDMVFEK